jgi:hypothetical protein
MPIPKIKRFSRSKVPEQVPIIEEERNEIIHPVIETKPKRGRNNKKVKIEEIEEIEQPIYDVDSPISPIEDIDFDYQPEDNNFLEELNNVNYKEEVKQTAKQIQQQQQQYISDAELLMTLQTKKPPKKGKKQVEIKSMLEDDDSLFDDIGTEIIGRDKREMIAKITQYKNLFPSELKKFKVKKNASAEELKVYLDEMESIVDCSSLENFLTDSILQCIKLVEGVSTYTQKYNIDGCADMLKTNPQFNQLCKRLYIKYKVFSEIPPEYQMIMIVATTAYISKTKNSKKYEINNYLNQPIQQNQ